MLKVKFHLIQIILLIIPIMILIVQLKNLNNIKRKLLCGMQQIFIGLMVFMIFNKVQKKV